jgi:hypothetical protein
VNHLADLYARMSTATLRELQTLLESQRVLAVDARVALGPEDLTLADLEHRLEVLARELRRREDPTP